LDAAARLVAGVRFDYGLIGDTTLGSQPVSREQQRAGLKAMQRALSPEVLHIPESVLAVLTPPSVEFGRGPEYFSSLVGSPFDAQSAVGAATALVTQFAFAPQRLNRIATQQDQQSPFSIAEYFDAMVGQMWMSTNGRSDWLVRTRNWVLLDAALWVLANGGLHASVEADWRWALRHLAERVSEQSSDGAEAARLIRQYLRDPSRVKLRTLPVIPPGAPI
jgi:Met-zincin